MASTYSTNLRLEMIGSNEQKGVWGATTNVNLGTLLEEAVGGYISVAIPDTNYTLTALNGAPDESRPANIKITGTLTATRNVVCPAAEKSYVVWNATNQSIVFKCNATAGVTIPSGSKSMVFVDGSTVQEIVSVPVPIAQGGTGSTSAANARTALGLGTIATQNSASVSITGGSIAGITDLAIADGGTGASTAENALANLAAAGTGVANTFTEQQTFSGGVTSGFVVKRQGGANEGGEFYLELPVSGSSLNGNVVVDLNANAIRFFENGGTFRGAYIDLTAQLGSTASKVITTSSTGEVVTAVLADGAVTSAKIATGTIATANIGGGQVTTEKIADFAVTTAELGNGAVTTAKIADGAVTSAELATSAVTTVKIADGAVTAEKIAAGAIPSGFTMPSGSVMPYAGASEPSGWLFCYGQAISRTTYAALFSALSTTYGAGDGSTTFNLPDLRGRVVAGQDDMGGTSANRLTNQSGGVDGDALGAAGGAETHTLTIAQIPSHNHTSFGPSGSGSFQPGGNPGESGTSSSTGFTGGGGAHNNVQPTIILNYIIKT